MNDRLRALDAVEPPDLWPEIQDRALVDGGTPAEPRPRRTLLLAAAVVVVLAGIAGGLVLLRAGGDAPSVAADDPSAMWGRVWRLTSMTVDGEALDVPEGGRDGTPYQLDLSPEGHLSTAGGCNVFESVSTVRLDGDVLVAGNGVTTAVGCEPLGLRTDAAFFALLSGRPTVLVDGHRLTLRTADTVGEFVDTPPDAIWGDRWDLRRLRVDGDDVELPSGRVRLDLREHGVVAFSGCNVIGIHAELVDGHLLPTSGVDHTDQACAPEREGIDDSLTELLVASPRIRMDARHLLLNGGGVVADFDLVENELDPVGPARCAADIDSSVGASEGPSAPPILDTTDWPSTPSVAHVDRGEQRAEIHVPGQFVIDLVGERTQPVDVDGARSATAWLRHDDVQIRVQSAGVDGLCGFYTVTVVGPDEATNVAWGVQLAGHVHPIER